MFCRNCKAEVAENAVICVHCGVKPLDGKNFCNFCGHPTQPQAQVCVGCGAGLKDASGDKSWLVTLLLCFFVGYIGIHRFYTGYTLFGVIQLCTLGGCGVWALIDLILIICGSYKDVNGNALKRD